MKVSVIIRNRNEEYYLRYVLKGLSLQNTTPEIILVDNESSDNSVEAAREYGARIVHLPHKEFTYGRALNLGIRKASGEICVILSAHSMPHGPEFLSACIQPFRSDPRLAAVRCLLAGKGADRLRWLEPETLDDTADEETVISKGPLASGCAIRRSVWKQIPFD